MKTCKKTDCSNPVFGGGYCRRHQYLRQQEPIPAKSAKRIEDDKLYRTICREIDKTKAPCYFCDRPIEGKADHHHLLGRTGSLYTDKRYIKRVHRTCHDIHKYSWVSRLVEQPWWEGYLDRLKADCPEAWEAEMMRLNKQQDHGNKS